MAKRKGDGKDEAALGLFHEMLAELRSINQRVGRVEERLGRVEGELHDLRASTERGFAEVTARLENIRDLAGEQYRRLEERVSRLEAKGSAP